MKRYEIEKRLRSFQRRREHRDKPPPIITPTKPVPRCRPIGRGDEDYCPTCGMCWPQVEERPPCPKGLDDVRQDQEGR